MRVAVGSENPVKLSAAETAFAELAGSAVESVAVESGVSEQPVGRAETVSGAENRARAAVAAGPYDLGVGIEGGVEERDPPGGCYLIMWAAITDGDRVEFGAGPSIRLPESIADRIRDGAELGPVLDERLGTDGIAENEGAAGVLTGNAVDRREALRTAVAGALGPFVTAHY